MSGMHDALEKLHEFAADAERMRILKDEEIGVLQASQQESIELAERRLKEKEEILG
jgi:hypothetical protein